MINSILTEEQYQRLVVLIKESETILICCHQNPDGDALGSSLALTYFLEATFGKKAQVIVPDRYPDYLHWLPGSERIIRYDKHKEGCDWTIEHADLVFCLDFNTLSRTATMEQALSNTKARKVLIDHHLAPNIDAHTAISFPEASSTSELVFRLVWQASAFEQMDKKFATCIYCGMMTDTGSFSYNSNDPQLFEIIALLLTKRINKDKIYRNVYHNFSVDRMRLMGYVLSERLTVIDEKHASYFDLTRDVLARYHFIKGDAEGLVNMPLQIKGMKLSISLREDTEKDNLIWVSLRSVDDFPCNEMAERYFNGGGHLNASGGRLYCTMAEAIDITRRAIEEML